MDTEARQSGLIADTYPERVEPVEVSPRPSDRGNDRETSPLPVRARSCAAGLGVLQPGGRAVRAVLSDFPDLVPFRLTISERPTPVSAHSSCRLQASICAVSSTARARTTKWTLSLRGASQWRRRSASKRKQAGASLTEAPLSEVESSGSAS